MTTKTLITYTVHLTSNSRYGTNRVYYFRTEAEAKNEAASLRRWYDNTPTQKIHIESHTREGQSLSFFIMFIVAINNGKEWEKVLACSNLADARSAYEKIDALQVGIFKQRPDWQYKNPRILRDNRDKSKWMIRGLESIINTFDDYLR